MVRTEMRDSTGHIQAVSGSHEMNSRLSCLLFFGLSIGQLPAAAEGTLDHESSLMSHARKIQSIETVLKTGAGCATALKVALKDTDPYARRVVVDRCGDQLAARDENLLNEDGSWIVQDALRTHRVKSRLTKASPESRWKYFQRIARVAPHKISDVAEMFIDQGWAKSVDEVHLRIPKAANKTSRIRERARAASKLKALPSAVAIPDALRMLGDPESPATAEEALRNLVKLGTPALQAALSGLKAATPRAEPPPWTPMHTAFQRRLKLIMALPDARSVPLLEQIQNSGSAFVRRETSRALKWVRSGVRYPVDHEAVLLLSEDDRSPLLPEADELP